jgi:VWFA-related protein
MRDMSRLIWLVPLVLCSTILALGQDATDSSGTTGQQGDQHTGKSLALIPRSHEMREAVYQAQHRITLTVQVADGSANSPGGLSREDFSILDNGQPRQILDFKPSDGNSAPVSLFLLIDSVNNSAQRVEFERREITAYLTRNSGKLLFPTTIGLMKANGVVASEPTTDGLAASIELKMMTKGLRATSCGEQADLHVAGFHSAVVAGDGLAEDINNGHSAEIGQCLNDRFKASIAALGNLVQKLQKTPGRVLMIAFGAGWSTFEGKEFVPDTRAASLRFYDYLANIQNALRESQITLSSISTPEELKDAGVMREQIDRLMREVPAPETAHARHLALQALAFRSGGLVLSGTREIPGAIAKCAADGASFYSLSFDTPPTESSGEYHALQIAAKQGWTVRTATSYFARP